MVRSNDPNPEAFSLVKQVVAGRQRCDLTGLASKVLRFILESPEGADVSISIDRFEIRFGWHPSRHRYFLSLAPSVVSNLMTWAEIQTVSGLTFGGIKGRDVPPMPDWPLSWRFEDRNVWLRFSGDALLISVRDRSTDATAGEQPPPLPQEIKAARRDIHLDTELPCVKCGAASRSFRVLGFNGGEAILVCPRCGCSFERPEGSLLGTVETEGAG